VAGVDADVQRQPCRVVAESLADPCELAMHLERDEERAVRIVLVRDRRAEEREERVACELLDEAVIAADDAREAADDGVDHLEELLRVEAVGEGGEAGDVREERRDQAPLLLELAALLDDAVCDRRGDEAAERVVRRGRRRLGCRGPAAMAAEPHPLGVRAAAGAACPLRHA
jgi:hypothetical protein